jgi:two-component system LytT family response regulator
MPAVAARYPWWCRWLGTRSFWLGQLAFWGLLAVFLLSIKISDAQRKESDAEVWTSNLALVLSLVFAPESLVEDGKAMTAVDLIGGGSFIFALISVGNVSCFGCCYYRGCRESLIERLRLEAAVKEAELRTLKDQVNPHFLFNSLNTLRSMIPGELERPREAVTLLAELLRASLTLGDRTTVSVAEELETVESYLDLEQLRFEKRLRVRARVDAAVREVQMPPFVLQTLVENTVKFGVGTRREGGEVAYAVARRDGVLSRRVENAGQLRTTSESTGLGLANVRARLRHLYGPAATRHVDAGRPRSGRRRGDDPCSSGHPRGIPLMNAIIVDDERPARIELTRLLGGCSSVRLVGEAESAEAARTLIERLRPDLVFLDIEMSAQNGFDLLESLEPPHPHVIFTTAYNAYAVRAFEVNALDYLLKPSNPRRLADALERVAQRYASGPAAPTEQESGGGPRESTGLLQPDEHVFVRDGDRCWFVPVRSLRLLEPAGNHTRLYFDKATPLLYRTLNSMEERLPPALFMRANRFQIINLTMIEKIGQWLADGDVNGRHRGRVLSPAGPALP